MRNDRQKYLYLSSRLFELAAEFTDAELLAMLNQRSKGSRERAIEHAIQALMELHHASPGSAASPDVPHQPREPADYAASPQAMSLSTLFDDQSSFPSVAHIARVIGLPVRAKESRDRYVARAIKHLESLSARDKARFIDDMASRLDRQPESFISKWTKVIKGA